MKPRKTVRVLDMVTAANHFLRTTAPDQRRERVAVASFLEVILHKADAYAGFNYLESAGMVRGDDGYATGEFTDESRRVYYVRAGLS